MVRVLQKHEQIADIWSPAASETIGNSNSVVRVHPIQKHIFAGGGKENELALWDANMLGNSEAATVADEAAKKRRVSSRKFVPMKPGNTWTARNVGSKG